MLEKINRASAPIAVLLVVVVLMLWGYYLVDKGFLDNAQFLAWNFVLWGLGIALLVKSRLIELKIGEALVVKLSEENNKAVKQLDQFMTLNKRFLRNALKTLELSPGYAGSFPEINSIDRRLEPFKELLKIIESDGLRNELHSEIVAMAEGLARSLIDLATEEEGIGAIGHKYQELPTIDELTKLKLTNPKILDEYCFLMTVIKS
ncbi:hypothetical protein [Shewanella dokdonensis]|uniref:LemA family protein n=1 Tax=Shewanella dokdonensis TaxID=712036 RepID=A0ABX8DGL2_9GAMM|nr:hypothetical protein [Shewanella dokdonensis]MCL1074154.1 hypothetical protein [Shewanella dokdonensis]QVK23884.1 hypothetical protein KHX94_04255 [Shewanella dokdonensis]